MAKSILVSTAILFCCAIIESSILSNLSFLMVVPDLVLICSIYFSLLNGKLYGELSGCVSGIFLDFITGVPFGFNTVYRTIIGYVAGFFSETIIISGIIMPVLSVSLGTILKRFLMLVIALLYPRIHLHVYGFISYEFLFEFIANIVLAPLMFKFLGFFNKQLSISDAKDKVDEYD